MSDNKLRAVRSIFLFNSLTISCYTLYMTKPEIRKHINELLTSPSVKTTLSSQSRKICEIILKSKRYTSCTTLLAYMPLPDEVDITPVIEDALKCGKKVFLPRIIPETSHMEFYRYDDTVSVHEGSFGIREPEVNEEERIA